MLYMKGVQRLMTKVRVAFRNWVEELIIMRVKDGLNTDNIWVSISMHSSRDLKVLDCVLHIGTVSHLDTSCANQLLSGLWTKLGT